jgi:hypothetical protein
LASLSTSRRLAAKTFGAVIVPLGALYVLLDII